MRLENSFIAVDGIGETTERRLWEAGITHWEAFDGSAPGIGPTKADRVRSFIDTAQERLAARDAAFFEQRLPTASQWRLYGNFRAETCFFDIETTGLDPDRDEVTVVSFYDGTETTTLVSGRDLTTESLQAALADVSLLVSFNGKQFDVPFLERNFALSIDRPHLDLMYPCRQLDLTGGLKSIEQELGIDRDRPDLSGRDAVRLWHAYEAGDHSALETLISYNREDTRNLESLLEYVTTARREQLLADISSTPLAFETPSR
ncbi:MAG: ribonuclease H-like domain-containing protein [Halobacteriales archaeon]|nr:ribonuclease H-like domain-containing protein [Halobacteriales archaeon]